MGANADIAPIIREETACVECLLATLDEELAALADRDSERLSAITTDKLRLVQTLEGLANQRRLLVGPVAPDTDWADSPQRRPVQPAWKRLTSLVDQARQNNRRNATAIDAASRYTRRAVDVLLGRRQSDTVYGALGQRRHLTTSRYSSTA